MAEYRADNGELPAELGPGDGYRIFVESLNEGAAVIGSDGSVIYANMRLADMLQLRLKGLVGTRLSDYVTSAELQEFSALLEEARRRRCKGEFTLITAAGTPLPVQASCCPLDIAGSICISMVVTDLSAQKRREELRATQAQLRHSEERFRLMADAMPAFVWTVRPEGVIDYVNRRFLEYTGSPSYVGAEGFIFPVHPDDRAATDEVYAKAMRNGEPYEMEHRLRRYDGAYRWYLCRGVPTRDASGNITKWYGTSTDIHDLREEQERRKKVEEELRLATEELDKRVKARTAELARMVATLQEEVVERIEAEESLRTSETLLNTVLESLPVAVWVLDANAEVVTVNPAGKEVWVEDRRTEGSHYKGWQHDTGRPVGRQEWGGWRAVFQGETTLGAVLDIECFDGSRKTILYSAVPLVNRRGDVLGAVVVNQDITERIRNEQALQAEVAERLRAIEELRRKDRLLMQQSRLAAMGEMIGNIAHQWRQPLNALGLIIQDLSFTHDLGALDVDYLKRKTDQAMEIIWHMSQTIDDFRNFFKPDKEIVTFAVNEVVAKTVSLIAASLNTMSLIINVAAEGEFEVQGYPNEYSQVLLNILMNARDALGERNVTSPRIDIRIFREKERVVVTITDNAGGIDEDIMDNIFDPYFTTKGPDRGTGIGLFMAKTIVEKNMKGSLSARNTGSGAEFLIEL